MTFNIIISKNYKDHLIYIIVQIPQYVSMTYQGLGILTNMLYHIVHNFIRSS